MCRREKISARNLTRVARFRVQGAARHRVVWQCLAASSNKARPYRLNELIPIKLLL